ncbi:MAG: isoaspartyl peptidase/L-asparaginase [bacterium]
MNKDANTPVIVIHGGAGTILRDKMTPELEEEIRATLEGSLKIGYAILQRGGSALDAVQRAINIMEDSPLFNAGKGAVFTHEGHNEQDATIVDGATGQVGSVAGVRHIRNPINLARMVMSRSPHVLLAGDGAESFALSQGMTLVDDQYFFTDRRYKQLEAVQLAEKKDPDDPQNRLGLSEDDRSGTVGAVALDQDGHLAAATSSGGMTNKRWGRVGDSALIGAGTWADKRVAISATGHGEFFMRAVTAYDVAARMKYAGMPLSEACAASMKQTGPDGTGGFIALDNEGHIELPFNTTGMYRGYLLPGAQPWVGIFEE